MYLGLDNALSTTGWCILKDKNTLIDCGKWTTKTSQRLEQRLGQIWEELNSLYNKFEFSYIYFEDCYKQPNIQTYQKLSMVKATILLWCYFNEVSCSCSEPSHWRKIIKSASGLDFGVGREENKQKAIQFVEQQFNCTVESDIADSINICYAGLLEKKEKKSAF